ncbi:MAG: hypothetical protein U0457_13875 [Candidatus Sericytochromatia bacterium]
MSGTITNQTIYTRMHNGTLNAGFIKSASAQPSIVATDQQNVEAFQAPEPPKKKHKVDVPKFQVVSNEQSSAFKNFSCSPSLLASNASMTQIPIYTMRNDRTLPTAVITREHFGKPSDYREGTYNIGGINSTGSFNPLIVNGEKIKSGFHEVVPTNIIEDFHEKYTSLSSSSSSSSPSYNKDSLGIILSVSSSFRTDTARTIMSDQNGEVALHVYSADDPHYHFNQERAHDLLRAPLVDIAKLDPSTEKGLTPNSVACVIGAISVSSMAPGESIENEFVKHPNDLLSITGANKPRDGSSFASWEDNRNIAKQRVNAVFSTLNPDEQAFVRRFSANYLTSVGRSIDTSHERATSPVRGASAMGAKTKCQASAYLNASSSSLGAPSVALSSTSLGSPSIATSSFSSGLMPDALRNVDVFPPSYAKDLGYYFTQPFRAAKW